MHDIKFIRQYPDIFDKKCLWRGLKAYSKRILDIDKHYRELKTKKEQLLADRNIYSRQVAELVKQKQSADDIIEKVNLIKKDITIIEEQEQHYFEQIERLCETIPNLVQDDTPVGKNEDDNVEIRRHGTISPFSFTPKTHFELGEALHLMDFETASQLSGARFVILRKDLARLERAIGNFMIDTHIYEHGLEETSVPQLVRRDTVYGTGQLPKFADDLYHTNDGLWLIPTAEVPLTAQKMNQIVERHQLPLRYCAWSACYRSEAGAAGRDTRGMIRQHQFYKVEMVTLTTADQSHDELERMTQCAENILQKLHLPYRVITLCTGDIGFSAQKTYDIEVWLPSEQNYREISSCSNCGDFQARRLQMRTRTIQHKGTELLHSLNGSGLATGRTLVAVMENYQQEDGSIVIPDVLVPYMQGQKIITPS